MNPPRKADGTLDAQAIIDQARATLAATRRMLAEGGLDPQACVEALRQAEGEATVERVKRHVEEMLREHVEQIRREAFQASPARPVSRMVARRDPV